MTKQIKRVIGFLLYHREQIASRSCNFCARMGKVRHLERCKYCKSVAGHLEWVEDKSDSLEDLMTEWKVISGTKEAVDYPWENLLTDEVNALLDKINTKGDKHE